jgi:hypothetical protein
VVAVVETKQLLSFLTNYTITTFPIIEFRFLSSTTMCMLCLQCLVVERISFQLLCFFFHYLEPARKARAACQNEKRV